VRLTGEGTSFRKSLKVEVRDEALSPFGGVVLLREFEERSGFLGRALRALVDPRRASHVLHELAVLFRFAVYRIVLGMPDVLDAERLRHDPVLRAILAPEHQDRLPGLLPGKSTLHRFLTHVLSCRANRRVLWRTTLDTALHPLLSARKKPRRIFVDLDSTEIEAHGQQQGAVNNGHFRSICFHALSLSLAPFGTTLGFLLRPGHVATARHAVAFVMPILHALRRRLGPEVQIVLRADSGFAVPLLFRRLEQAGFFYVIRMRENARLCREFGRISHRPPGRPSSRRSLFRYASGTYRSRTWSRARRVVARAEFVPGFLFPDWIYLCVHLPDAGAPEELVRTYLERGRSEQVHDLFKNEMHGALMSHHRLVHNQVRAWLTAIALNLLLAFEFRCRGPRPPTRPATLRTRLLLRAASMLRHARSLVLRLSATPAENRLLRDLAARIRSCRPPPALVGT